MTTPSAPVYEQAATPAKPSKGNGFGTAALVLGIIALVFSFIPVAVS
ncbi:hypothetical protein IV498_10805 [Paenarthrobacter sp. Z7-10]|nr:hypothetical protein [Paenarthrobacter sp. Z7-10]MCZ2403659.1 hypothetical protein [Paenarthrobacter sp. Z7-10]